MSNKSKPALLVNNSNYVQQFENASKINTDLHLKLECLLETSQRLLSDLYSDADKVKDSDLKQSMIKTIWQIETILDVLKENLNYNDFLAVEELMFNLTKKIA